MNIWIFKIFSQEFGFSDVRSNYSRVYSWMANQLGHMTLGMAVALFFYWIIESFKSAASVADTDPGLLILGFVLAAVATGGVILWWTRDVPVDVPAATEQDLARPARIGAYMRNPARYIGLVIITIGMLIIPLTIDIFLPRGGFGGFLDAVNVVLLGSPPGLIVGIIAGTIIRQFMTPPLDPASEQSGPTLDARRYYRAMGKHANKGWMAFAVAVALFNGWLFNWDNAKINGAITAALVIGLAVVVLSKDWRFTLIGLLGALGSFTFALTEHFESEAVIAGAEFMATPFVAILGALTGSEAALTAWMTGPDFVQDWFAYSGVVLILVFIFALLVIASPPASSYAFDRIFYAVSALLIAYWYWHLIDRGVDKEWAVPIASAIASMSIWLVKEFGSDLPKVYQELLAARRDRANAGTVEENDRGAALEHLYIHTAHWDARTDGAFYLVGAWIGAAVLSDGTLLTNAALDGKPVDGAWGVGSELIGLILFAVTFIAGGRNWGYRQQALDTCGASRANMLAVVDFKVEMYERPLDTNPQPMKEPRQACYDFTMGEERFRHILAIGDKHLCQRFADAIVTEAALADLRPEMFADLKDRSEYFRRARRLTYDLLEQYNPATLTKAELPYTPVWSLDCNPRAGDRVPPDALPVVKRPLVNAASGNETGAPTRNLNRNADFPAADVVAITHAPHDPSIRSIAAGLDRLPDRNGGNEVVQSTIWFINEPDPHNFASPADLLFRFGEQIENKFPGDQVAVAFLTR